MRPIVINDSIVRGNTSKKLVEMLRGAGATEVHLRIVSPEVMWPCFYSIDTDTQNQLMCANMTNAEACEFIGCDSPAFISIGGLRQASAARIPRFATPASPATTPCPSPARCRRGVSWRHHDPRRMRPR